MKECEARGVIGEACRLSPTTCHGRQHFLINENILSLKDSAEALKLGLEQMTDSQKLHGCLSENEVRGTIHHRVRVVRQRIIKAQAKAQAESQQKPKPKKNQPNQKPKSR
jgi:hypothetical protein